MTLSLLLLPFIGAIIGWFTNYIAVKMLFHPTEPVKVGPLTIQGIFPKRQDLIATRIGKVVAEELLTVGDLRDKVINGNSMGIIRGKVGRKIDEFLDERMPKRFPLLSLLMRKKMKVNIRTELLSEIEHKLPVMIDDYVNHVESSIDIEEMVRHKFSQLSSDKLEQVLHEILKKEFRFIEYVGAVLGFVIGLIEVGLVVLGT